MLYLLALYEGARLGRMDAAALASHIAELLGLPAALESQLDAWREQTAALGGKYNPPPRSSISAAASTTPSRAKARSN